MSRRRATVGQLAVIFGLIGLGVLLAGPWLLRLFSSDKGRIVMVIDTMAEAVSDKDNGGVMEHLSGRYRHGSMTRDHVQRMLAGYFLRTGPITCTVGPVGDNDIDLDGDRATARFNALVTEPGAGRARAWAVTLTMVREEGRWRVLDHAMKEIDWRPE